jgi:hypothetical protein
VGRRRRSLPCGHDLSQWCSDQSGAAVVDSVPSLLANADAMSLALAQFNEQGLIPVSVETQGQVITVKVNTMNVVTASVSLLHLLLDEVVSASGGTVTSHDIIVRLREQLDASED